MYNKFFNKSFLVYSLFCFIVSQIILLNFIFATIAKEPKNYLKGKFYESVENNFLVATERMPDERFKEAVILMLSSSKEGAWGLAVNKQIGSVPLKVLIDTPENIKDEEKDLYEKFIPIFWGGPVDEKQIFVLHSDEYKSKSTKKYSGFSITRDAEIFFDIAKKKGPKKSLIILGYSGWGDGQLEGEIEMDHWILSKIEIDIMFEEELIKRWIKATKNSFIRL